MIQTWTDTVNRWLEENDRSQAWLANKTPRLSVQHFNRCMKGHERPSQDLLQRLQKTMSEHGRSDEPVRLGGPQPMSQRPRRARRA